MFKKLIEYLPDYLRDFTEICAITEAEEQELLLVQARLDQTFANQFIDTADDATIKRMEKIFGIPVQPMATLEDRRFGVKATLNQAAPFTYRTLCKQLEALCGANGYSVDILPNYSVRVRIGLSQRNNFNAVLDIIERELPCNLLLDLDLLYNQHRTLSRRTHAQLSEYTHFDVRENEAISEVI